MSETQLLPLSVQPVVRYPREAQVGKTYLMTIDLQPSGNEWEYEEEEYAIYCMLETSPLFSSKPVGEPAIVMHRFGGSYGAAKFLLTAAQEEMEGEIRITLVNGWGVPIRVLSLDDVKIRQEINRPLKIIEEYQQETFVSQTITSAQELQKSFSVEDNQEIVDSEEIIEELEASVSSESSEELFNQENFIQPSYNLPSLNLAIARLPNTTTDSFAIWVVNAPYPSGYVLRDCVWLPHLTQAWQEWQQMFAGHSRLDISPGTTPKEANPLPLDFVVPPSGQTTSYTARLMQYLGISLWNWVFDGIILNTFERSGGIAKSQNTRLRVRLEIRDPDLIVLPWEIMQREAGQSAISLSENVLFSRTVSEVVPLPPLPANYALNILLVLGEGETLQLEQKAAILEQTLSSGSPASNTANCMVDTLLQPNPEQLISKLETQTYNIFFYIGHGLPAPEGGLLFFRPDMTLNGIELAQVLTRTGVKLAVFGACWGAQPAAVNQQAIPHSSLPEVLICSGVPAVITMRDDTAVQEIDTFMGALFQALRERKPIDEAVAEARQQLLVVYKFNQPAWTLPVLYLHPDYNGELIKSFDEGITELPEMFIPGITSVLPNAYLRSLSPEDKTWQLRRGITRIGRTVDNDIIILEPSVSKRHAEIFCRITLTEGTPLRTYYLQDLSTYGTTWVFRSNGWQQIQRQEVPLESGMKLKFGSTKSQPWEFIIESS